MPIAVATCGTALGEDHLDLLRRFSERVVLAFDADEAGSGAALRGFDRSVPGDLDLRVAVLPEGRDPADVVQDGGIETLRLAVSESLPLLQVRIDAELAKFDLDEPEARSRAVKSAAAVIALHPDAMTRHEYANGVSRSTGVETRFIEQSITEIRRSARSKTSGERPSSPDGPPIERAASYKIESELLRAMLANDERLAGLVFGVSLFSDPQTIEAFPTVEALLEGLEPGEVPDLGSAIGSDESAQGDLLRAIALDRRPIDNPVELVSRLEVGRIDDEIATIKRALQTESKDTDEQEYSELLQRLVALEQQKREKRRIE